MNAYFRSCALALLASLGACVTPAHAADQANHCTYSHVATLPLRYVGTGLALIGTDGSINGKPATMIIAADSAMTYVAPDAVKRFGLPAATPDPDIVDTLYGKRALYNVTVTDFGVGQIRLGHTASLPVVGDTDDDAPSYDAVIGAPFLLHTDIEISLRDKQIKLFVPHDCDDTYLGYWKEDSIALPFHQAHDDPAAWFTVMLNGHKMKAVISTNGNTAVTLDAARRAGIHLGDPGVRVLHDYDGIRSWSAPFNTLAIGGETIRSGEIELINPTAASSTDLYLGLDFLRTHRVLLAMKQHQLYLAYLGGTPFPKRGGIPQWERQEAEAGNADAQYTLALLYEHGEGVPANPALENSWLEKAAAQGQPWAHLKIGGNLVDAGRYPDAIAHLHATLERLPSNRYAALWLYLARVHNGEAQLGKQELETRERMHADNAWPAPIVKFFLGELDGEKLLARAAQDATQAKVRRCQAVTFMTRWYAARGDEAHARALKDNPSLACAAAPAQAPAA
jgi:hypothetical protein